MKNRFIVLTILVCAVSSLLAVPAYRGPITHKQSDGTELVVYHHGDEKFSYFTNEAGQWLQADEKGDYLIVPALTDEEIALRRAESMYSQIASRRAIISRFHVHKHQRTNERMGKWRELHL